ncbi:MAG: hypothetical protein ACK4NQ_09955 [Fimbriimonadaceae bacterium]
MARGDEQLNRIFEQGLAGSSAEERQLMAIRDGLKSLKADVSCPVEFDDVMRRVRTESLALPAAAKGGFRLPWMWGGTMAVAATVVAFAIFMSRPQTGVSPTLAVETPTSAPLEAPLAVPDATPDTESAASALADQPMALGATDLDSAPTTTNNPVAALKREVANPRRSSARRNRPVSRPAPAPVTPAASHMPMARASGLPGNAESSGLAGAGGGAPAMTMAAAADQAAKEESVPVVLISERSGPVTGQNAAFEVESDDVVFGG